MVILVDANVVIDYILNREPFGKYAKTVMELCSKEEAKGFIALHSVSIIWYVLRRLPEHERREWLKRILKLLQVTGISHEDVVSAISLDSFKDFEDCLQDKCAIKVHAQYIITNNIKDFSKSVTKAVTPQTFCEKYL